MMDQEAKTFLEERSSFENMRKKVADVHFKKYIKLNVGGLTFKTSVETLVKDPHSMLASMFSERFELKPDEEDSAYFIDRDGTHFRLILNYLRTGELIYPRENKILARELYREAEFYQLTEVQKEIWPELAFPKSSAIVSSLTEEQKMALISWLLPEENFVKWVLLYSAAVHGWKPAAFHQRCDDRGPTVIIAKAGDYVFGGYAKVSWNSGSALVKDKKAFMFTLVNPTGASPTKIPNSGENGGIWCHPNYGPGFGNANGRNVCFTYNSNTVVTTCDIDNNDYGFVIPGVYDFSTLIFGSTGTSFVIKNLEVLGLKQSF